MSSFVSSSIGKKVVMALSGLFLIVFLTVHLVANLTLIIGEDAFNATSHFMGTNPLIQIMQPVLAIGFLVHIGLGIVFDLQNRSKTPVKYDIAKRSHASSFASRNMLVLGVAIFAFLVFHMKIFFEMKFGAYSVADANHYELVANVLGQPISAIAYIVAFIALGIHLDHGFQSSFQSMGFNNHIWRKRMILIGRIYTILVAGGFSAIALFFLLGFGK